MMQNYLEPLQKTLRQLKPYKAILFGSYAAGTPHEDSDIDVIVILNNDNMPRSFAERMENHIQVRRHLKVLNREIAMDVLVYTKAEWNKLLEMNSSFIREILAKGKSIL